MTTEQQILAAIVRPLIWEEDLRDRWIGTPVVHLGDLAYWIFRHHDGTFKRAAKDGPFRWQYHPTLEAAQAAAWEHYLSTLAAALDLGKVKRLVSAIATYRRMPASNDAGIELDAALADLGAAP